MNRAMIILMATALMPVTASAAKLQCIFERSDNAPTFVQLDTKTGTANVLYPGRIGSLRGTITRTAKAADGSDDYNLSFTNLETTDGKESEWEFLLHQNGERSSLIGAGYTSDHGKRYLSSSRGEYPAKCRVAEA